MNIDIERIINDVATVDEISELYEKKGYTFTIEDGRITEVIF